MTFFTSYSIRDHQYILTNGDYRNPSKKEAVKNDPPPVLGPYSIF